MSDQNNNDQSKKVNTPTEDKNALVPSTDSLAFDPATLAKLQAAMKQLALSNPKPEADPTSSSHKFWSTQPVIHDNTDPNEIGPIEVKTLADVRAKPYPLPNGFEWDTLDLTNEEHLDEVYKLLYLNYVEDDDCHFRFHYSKDFLRWALMPPGYKRDWHLVVRRTSLQGSPIVGLITAIPSELIANNKKVEAVEVNFLCVHKDLRSKRIAPQLIKEITRRVNLCDIWQAAYTGGTLLPRPVSSAQYFHRSINPKKLIEVGFSAKPRDMSMLQVKKHYALPEKMQNDFVLMESKHIDSACKLYHKHFQGLNSQLYQNFTNEEFAHFLLPRDDIVNTYVKVDKEGNVTDFFSFYTLPSSIFGVKEHDTLNVAYSFYNIAETVSFKDLIKDALIASKSANSDVYNMLHLSKNEECFTELKFAPGDGTLYYYLYNWKTPQFPDDQLGLVMF